MNQLTKTRDILPDAGGVVAADCIYCGAAAELDGRCADCAPPYMDGFGDGRAQAFADIKASMAMRRELGPHKGNCGCDPCAIVRMVESGCAIRVHP